ncbi:MAG: Tol-Pal system beta propeller repeat protein TolB [Gammaproteobacteria bacterium]|nr:Tol-Pal system beta propeller repeat protein TolB [Gammaproteobacteria bacterium]
MNTPRLQTLGLAIVIVAAQGLAALEIVIPEGWDSPTKVAVAPFGGLLRDEPDAAVSVDIAGIVAFDLTRTGQFSLLPSENMLSYPTAPDQVYFRDWRLLGQDYLVIGRAWAEANGAVSVVYHLFDVNSEREVASSRVTAAPEQLRDVAHRIADEVYEQITGIRGAFSTKLLYVLVENAASRSPTYHLKIADSDGARGRTVFRSREPLLSPSWAPDAGRIAYVSFETGKSTIVVHNLVTGERTHVAAYPGINGAPEFSPDGTKLAMSLSRDGNSEIYTLDLASRELRRITRWPTAIDTEPSWTADGDGLIFTSDRSGKPQIYRIGLDKLLEERLTFEGDYNARARLLPNGRHLVYVHRRERVYHIAWQDLERDTVRVLTQTALDESPSLSPNGVMMIYATQDLGRGILAVVSIDNGFRYLLPEAAGDVREPAWSPFLDTLRGSR